jgi:hypothetical protein
MRKAVKELFDINGPSGQLRCARCKKLIQLPRMVSWQCKTDNAQGRGRRSLLHRAGKNKIYGRECNTRRLKTTSILTAVFRSDAASLRHSRPKKAAASDESQDRVSRSLQDQTRYRGTDIRKVLCSDSILGGIPGGCSGHQMPSGVPDRCVSGAKPRPQARATAYWAEACRAHLWKLPLACVYLNRRTRIYPIPLLPLRRPPR